MNFNEKVLNLIDSIDHVTGTRKELPDKIREYMDELRNLICDTIVIDTITEQEYRVGPYIYFIGDDNYIEGELNINLISAKENVIGNTIAKIRCIKERNNMHNIIPLKDVLFTGKKWSSHKIT